MVAPSSSISATGSPGNLDVRIHPSFFFFSEPGERDAPRTFVSAWVDETNVALTPASDQARTRGAGTPGQYVSSNRRQSDFILHLVAIVQCPIDLEYGVLDP